jgi:ABC-type multidrug transport system fused ATPase/permease subunit
LNINRAQELIIPFTFLFAVAALVSGLIRILLLWYQIRIGHLIGSDLSLKIYKVALYQPYKTHISVNSSQSISTITEKSNAIVRQVILPFLFLISSTFIFLSIFTALFVFNSNVAIFLFLFFGIIYFIIYTFTKNKLVNNSKILSSLLSKRIKILQEGFNGIRDVILNGSQIAYTNTFKKVDLPLRRAQAINSFISSSPRFAIEALGMILISIMIYFIFMRDSNFNNTIPILGAFALGAQRMLPLIQQIYSNITAIKGTESILNDSLKILNQNFLIFILIIKRYYLSKMKLNFKM